MLCPCQTLCVYRVYELCILYIPDKDTLYHERIIEKYFAKPYLLLFMRQGIKGVVNGLWV
jgi:hypothetical protein